MDGLTLVLLIVGVLHSVWVALNIAECVAGHWLTGTVGTVVFMDTIIEDHILETFAKVPLRVTMWMVCL